MLSPHFKQLKKTLSTQKVKEVNMETSILLWCISERERNIQAAHRREEERQAGCHTSKTGTQLQQTAEITEHEGKRNRRCERHMDPVTKTQKQASHIIAKLVR